MTSVTSRITAITSRDTDTPQDKIIKTIVAMITESGFDTASPQSIADRAGVSLGMVEKLGSNSQMLDAVFLYGHERYLKLVDHKELLEGTLQERVQLYVSLSWRHYQSDLYLAVMEILLATRSRRDPSTFLNLQPELAEHHRAQVRKIFPECTLGDRRLMETLRYTHCFLTGLAIDKILEPGSGNLGGYLDQTIQAMTAMLEG